MTPTGKLLYSGPAGKIWTDGLALYNLTAQGVGVQGVMAGGPQNQPSPEEVAALNSAGAGAYGPLKPWMVAVIFMLLFLALNLLGAPAWTGWLLALLAVVALLGWPVYRQFKAYEGLFRSREELTILLSDKPTQMVSSVVEIHPDTPAQTIKATRQPVALVLHGLPLAERIKLSGGVTRHVAMGQMAARRK